MTKNLDTKRIISIWILFAFLGNYFVLPPAHAQELSLPAPGVRVELSLTYNPPLLKGLKVYPDNPFRFDFILDQGDSAAGQAQATRLIKYFLASLTIPEKDLWVNLSPYEKNRIVPESFGQTEMGRDLLAEDYMLKQITASLIYPEGEIGKRFWKRIYEEAAKKFGTTNIPVNTFNKVWIVPEKAVVYENAKAGTAYVVEAKLKVMLEQDYLSLEKHLAMPQNDVSTLGSQIVREIVIPELTREVNEDKNFAQLRQVYNSLILAIWYKKKIKDSILAQVYEDKKKVAGIVLLRGSATTEAIYQRYLQAFKKGVYNYIKEDMDPATQQPVPRKYFSGGVNFFGDLAMTTTADPAMLPSSDGKSVVISGAFKALAKPYNHRKVFVRIPELATLIAAYLIYTKVREYVSQPYSTVLTIVALAIIHRMMRMAMFESLDRVYNVATTGRYIVAWQEPGDRLSLHVIHIRFNLNELKRHRQRAYPLMFRDMIKVIREIVEDKDGRFAAIQEISIASPLLVRQEPSGRSAQFAGFVKSSMDDLGVEGEIYQRGIAARAVSYIGNALLGKPSRKWGGKFVLDISTPEKKKELLEKLDRLSRGRKPDRAQAAKLAHTAVVFAPSGYQSPGMGNDLYEAYPEVREIYDEVNNIARRVLKDDKFDVKEFSFKASNGEFSSKGMESQVAVVAYEIALWEIYKKEVLKDHSPQMVLGISRGIMAAYYASGVLDLEHTVELTIKHTRYLIEASRWADDRRMAVVRMDPDQWAQFLKDHPEVTVTIRISDSSRTISAPWEAFSFLQNKVEAMKGVFRPVKLPFASHDRNLTKHIASVKAFKAYLEAVPFKAPDIVFYSDVHPGKILASPEDIRDDYWQNQEKPLPLDQVVTAFQAAQGIQRVVMIGARDFLIKNLNEKIRSSLSVESVVSRLDIRDSAQLAQVDRPMGVDLNIAPVLRKLMRTKEYPNLLKEKRISIEGWNEGHSAQVHVGNIFLLYKAMDELIGNALDEQQKGGIVVKLFTDGGTTGMSVSNTGNINYRALKKRLIEQKDRLVEFNGDVILVDKPVSRYDKGVFDYMKEGARRLSLADIVKIKGKDLLWVVGLSRGKTDDEYGGAGMGLNLIRKNIKILGGKFLIDTGKGRTTFTVEFQNRDSAQSADLAMATRYDWNNIKTVGQIVGLKRAEYQRLIEKTVPVFQSTIDFIKEVHDRTYGSHKLKLAVASASVSTGSILKRIGVARYLDIIVDGNQTILPRKPSVGFYQGVANELGVRPENSVVIEDAVVGVKSAKAGGFKLVIGIDRDNDREKMIEAGADLVIKDMDEITMDTILERVPNIEGIIFDSDGVITNTEPLHFEATKTVLDDYFRFRERMFGVPFVGLTLDENIRYLKSQADGTGFENILAARGIHLDNAMANALSEKDRSLRARINSYLNDTANRHDPIDSILARIRRDNINVIALGESHTSSSTQRLNRKIIRELIKQQAITHFGVEIRQFYISPLKLFLSLWSSSYPSLGPEDVIRNMRGSPQESIREAGEDVRECFYINFWPNEVNSERLFLLRELNQAHVDIFSIDSKLRERDPNIDQEMAKNIRSVIKQDKKAKIVVSVGSNHAGYTGFGKFLKRDPDIKYYSIALYDPTGKELPMVQEGWSNQNDYFSSLDRMIDEKSLGGKNIFVEHLSQTPLGDIKGEDGGRTLETDFDSMILVGDEDSAQLAQADRAMVWEEGQRLIQEIRNVYDEKISGFSNSSGLKLVIISPFAIAEQLFERARQANRMNLEVRERIIGELDSFGGNLTRFSNYDGISRWAEVGHTGNDAITAELIKLHLTPGFSRRIGNVKQVYDRNYLRIKEIVHALSSADEPQPDLAMAAPNSPMLTSMATYDHRLDHSNKAIWDMLRNLKGRPRPVIYDIGIGFGDNGPAPTKELADGAKNAWVVAIDSQLPEYQVITATWQVLYDANGKVLSVQKGDKFYNGNSPRTDKEEYFKEIFHEIQQRNKGTYEFLFRGEKIKVIYRPMLLHQAPNIHYILADLFNLSPQAGVLSQHKADIVRITNLIFPHHGFNAIIPALRQLSPFVNEGGKVFIGQVIFEDLGEEYLIYQKQKDDFILTDYALGQGEKPMVFSNRNDPKFLSLLYTEVTPLVVHGNAQGGDGAMAAGIGDRERAAGAGDAAMTVNDLKLDTMIHWSGSQEYLYDLVYLGKDISKRLRQDEPSTNAKDLIEYAKWLNEFMQSSKVKEEQKRYPNMTFIDAGIFNDWGLFIKTASYLIFGEILDEEALIQKLDEMRNDRRTQYNIKNMYLVIACIFTIIVTEKRDHFIFRDLLSLYRKRLNGIKQMLASVVSIRSDGIVRKKSFSVDITTDLDAVLLKRALLLALDQVPSLSIGDRAMAGITQDAAMRGDNFKKGGIDLGQVKVDSELLRVSGMRTRLRGNDNEGIKFHLDPAMLEQLRNAPGFVPVIINVRPLTDLRKFLGIAPAAQ